MPTRNVVLTKHQEKVIETLIGSGRYQNASEVLCEGLRLVEQREAEDTAKLKILREAAESGFGALDRGEFREFDSIADLQAYLNALLEHPEGRPGEKISVDKLPDDRTEVKAAQSAAKISDAFKFLKKSNGPVLSIEEMSEIAARGWAGKR